MSKEVTFTYVGVDNRLTIEERIAMYSRHRERNELIKLRDKLGIPKLKS